MTEFHPLANIFPLIDGADFDDLVKDIRQHGLREPIILLGDKILDGRNRYRACVEAKVLPAQLSEVTVSQLRHIKQFAPLGGPEPSHDDLLAFVISKNLHRRHMDKSQRSMAAADAETLRHGANQHTAGDANLHLRRETLAAQFHVSERSVADGAVVRDQGVAELGAAVRQGKIAVSAAVAIAQQPVERQAEIVANLPRDASGKLTPEAKKALAPIVKEIRAEKQVEKKARRDQREIDLANKILALPDVRAGLIISDFEWHFKVYSEVTGMDRHASNHYVTARESSTPEDIVERQRERMSIAADDCIHLMWVPASFSAIGHKVMELQGFTYVSQFVWVKPSIGTGFWVRDKHELLFIGVKGDIPCPAMGDQFDSAIEAPKGAHSEKPDFQYDIAEHYFPNLPKIELNARRYRKGWIQWGNEAPTHEAAE